MLIKYISLILINKACPIRVKEFEGGKYGVFGISSWKNYIRIP